MSKQKLDFTTGGKPKKPFELVDKNGYWIECVAMGRNAMIPALQTGKDVVLYNVSGGGPIVSSEGAIYLFKDAMVVPVGTSNAIAVIEKEKKIESMSKWS